MEARALAQLRHDNIVCIHRIVDREDLLAYEMEWVDGPSLRQTVDALRAHGAGVKLEHLTEILGAEPGALGNVTLVQYFVELGLAIARALHEVHEAGLIHRDVKPSNILIRRDGKPVLVDFGLARGLDPSVTRPGAFVGTPIYASPEQLRAGDEELDGRADVYSLGVTLYEAIALSPPFSGSSTTEVLRRIEAGRIPPLRRQAPHVSRDLETVLSKAMEPAAHDRYASAAEFGDDLERLLHLQPIKARPAGLVRRGAKFARRHRRTLIAGVVGAVVVAGALLPVVAHAGGDADARQRAHEHAQLARRHLISPESRQTIWRRSIYRGGGLLLWRHAGGSTDPTRAALDEYEKALELIDSDPLVQVERDVVGLAHWLRSRIPTPRGAITPALSNEQLDELMARLPTVTKTTAGYLRQYAEHAALTRPGLDVVRFSQVESGSQLKQEHRTEIEGRIVTAEPFDRLALGLLAFLLGDVRLCELAWSDRAVTDLDYPLRDAGLGLVYAADARPELAYPRLLHGVKAFPDSPLVAVELADAAVAMGSVELARDWLARPVLQEDNPELRAQLDRIRADLLAAEDRIPEAWDAYELAAGRDASNPASRYRMAQLALEHGNLPEADAQLRILLSDWPDVARYRLDLARVALQQEDLATYLLQAWYASQRLLLHNVEPRGDVPPMTGWFPFETELSEGGINDLLEILRIGGFSGCIALRHARDSRPTNAGRGSRSSSAGGCQRNTPTGWSSRWRS